IVFFAYWFLVLSLATNICGSIQLSGPRFSRLPSANSAFPTQGQFVGLGERLNNFLVDLVADVALALERDHILEICTAWDGDRRIRYSGIFIADVLDEEQHQDV